MGTRITLHFEDDEQAKLFMHQLGGKGHVWTLDGGPFDSLLAIPRTWTPYEVRIVGVTTPGVGSPTKPRRFQTTAEWSEKFLPPAHDVLTGELLGVHKEAHFHGGHPERTHVLKLDQPVGDHSIVRFDPADLEEIDG